MTKCARLPISVNIMGENNGQAELSTYYDTAATRI
jgi:hypothetical protein